MNHNITALCLVGRERIIYQRKSLLEYFPRDVTGVLPISPHCIALQCHKITCSSSAAAKLTYCTCIPTTKMPDQKCGNDHVLLTSSSRSYLLFFTLAPSIWNIENKHQTYNSTTFSTRRTMDDAWCITAKRRIAIGITSPLK